MLSYVMLILCYVIICYVMFMLRYVTCYVTLYNMLCYIGCYFMFKNYSPKAKLILLNNPRDEVEGIIQQY